MAWQVEGLSNNENWVRGNYYADGRPIVFEEIVRERDAVHGLETPVRVPRVVKGQPGRRMPNPEGRQGNSGGRAEFSPEAAAAEQELYDYDPFLLPVRPMLDSAKERGVCCWPRFPQSRSGWRMPLMDSLRRNGCGMPVRVLAQDYGAGLAWRGLAETRLARGCYGGKDDLRWLNKLQAIAETPFAETIFLDADMVAAGDISSWFDDLGADDFSF